MIETTVREINVAELMERVRLEARRPPPVTPSRQPAAPRPMPTVARLPAAPEVWIPGAVKSRKERLDRLVETAREKNGAGSGIPKFLRRFFRKQGGFNRAAVDSIGVLAKSNEDLTRRVSEISLCLTHLNSWLLAVHEQSDADAAWMSAATPAISKISGIETEIDRLGHDLGRARETIDGIRAQNSSLVVRHDRIEDQLQRINAESAARETALHEAVAQVRHDLAESVAERASALRSEFDRMGTHLRNLQGQTDRMNQQLAQLKEEAGEASAHYESRSNDLQHQFDQAGVHLRNLQSQADRLGVHINNLQVFVDKRAAEANAIHHAVENRLSDQAGLAQQFSAFEQRTVADTTLLKGELSEYASLLRRLLTDALDNKRPAAGRKSTRPQNGDLAATPGLDAFYVALEDRFRGPREEIKKRVAFYLPFLRKAEAGTAARPILDLGCGRGEWLELLKEEKLDGRGIDLNGAMVSQCKVRGLKVERRDALAALRSLRANSQGAVTAFHLIEHLPFEMLLELFREAGRVLKPGGVAIFESPNCKNLMVGACTFHIDPTHRSPVFPETAELMLGSQGFEKIRIEYLSPVRDAKFEAGTPELATIRDLLYGPQDFGIIAYKPGGR